MTKGLKLGAKKKQWSTSALSTDFILVQVQMHGSNWWLMYVCPTQLAGCNPQEEAQRVRKKQWQLERWVGPNGQESKLEWGNDNKARSDVIIFCKKTVLGTPRSVEASHGKNWNYQWPSAEQDGRVAIGGPAVIGNSSIHLLHTSLE